MTFVSAKNVWDTTPGMDKVYLKIYDAKGSLIVTESLSVNGSLYKEINLQSFPKGIYILNLQTDDGFKFVKKILKQ